jgi:hypothetical protein
MIVLTGRDAGKIKTVLEAFRLEIGKIKDGKAHDTICGCVDCDHYGNLMGAIDRIGEESILEHP